jgi:hypothetical protein
MRRVWRHVERDNRVLRAELIKFGTTVATVPVKDQESISADRTRLGMLIEDFFKPKEPQLIICPSILAGSNHCFVRLSLNLIPGCLMVLALEDDHG